MFMYRIISKKIRDLSDDNGVESMVISKASLLTII